MLAKFVKIVGSDPGDLNSRLKKSSGRCLRLWIGGPQKKIVKIDGPDPGAGITKTWKLV